MRRLWPSSDDAADDEIELTDAAVAVGHEHRVALPHRPWVVLNMVASADGASTDTEGRSRKLSGPADQKVFHALRATADVILAGASTVRAENYGTPRVAPELEKARRARGQAPLPRMAVVSGSLRLDPDARIFREAPADQPTLVLTSETSLATEPSATFARDLATVADVRPAGDAAVDWDDALRVLHDDIGARVLLVEGGPHVNGQLVARDLVDELCLTLSPVLLAGITGRIVAGTVAMVPQPLVLDRAFLDDDFLLLRYLRRRDGDRLDHGERYSAT